MSADEPPVVIIGAGLAGLACARHLVRAGVGVQLLEAADAVGGRVRTDEVAGFRLDRGFQVFLPAYPEAAAVLDYVALQLRPFYPGALIQCGARRYRFADPWRRPLASLSALLSPIATASDALRIARLRSAALSSAAARNAADSIATCDDLRQFGLSERVIERFFRPFFGGVFLERELQTPSWFFRFVFAMFASRGAALPANGMQAIPEQLAAELPAATVRLNTPVASVEPGRVHLASGETVACAACVVATDAHSAGRLVSRGPSVRWNGTTTVYYAAPRSPVREGILVLNGMGPGLVNHVCVPSDVAGQYAPEGRTLVSVSIIGVPDLDDAELSRRVVEELRGWFGEGVAEWERLRVYRIAHALPRISAATPAAASSAIPDGVYLCGDYLEDPSINGALVSGRQAAAAVLQTRPVR